MEIVSLYNYKGSLKRVIDGDTIEVVINLGFDLNLTQTVRVMGIDAPESRTTRLIEKQGGMFVKTKLIEALEGKQLYLKTYKDDKYGRYLADIFITDVEGNLFNIAEIFLKLGYFHKYDGGQRAEWTDEELQNIIKLQYN